MAERTKQNLFRKKALEALQSPDQLDCNPDSKAENDESKDRHERIIRAGYCGREV